MYKPLLATLMVGGLLAQAAVAAPDVQAFRYQLEVLRVPATVTVLDERTFVDGSELQTLLEHHEIQEVDVTSGEGTLGNEVEMLAGHKIPMGFKDPRAGGYQVQYVDSGLKVHLKVTTDAATHRYVVAAQTQKVGLEDPGNTSLPYLQGVQINTQFIMEPGKAVLLGRTRGHLTQALKLAWPGVSLSNQDTVVFALIITPL